MLSRCYLRPTLLSTRLKNVIPRKTLQFSARLSRVFDTASWKTPHLRKFCEFLHKILRQHSRNVRLSENVKKKKIDFFRFFTVVSRFNLEWYYIENLVKRQVSEGLGGNVKKVSWPLMPPTMLHPRRAVNPDHKGAPIYFNPGNEQLNTRFVESYRQAYCLTRRWAVARTLC